MRYTMIYAAAALALLAACSQQNTWTVKATIEGGAGKTVYLDASDNGRWYTLDSVHADNAGHLSFTQQAAAYPDIYRLRMDGRTVYFPIDSVETVTVVADAADFATGHRLSGTPQAELLAWVDSIAPYAVTDEGAKRAVTDRLLAAPDGIVAWYMLNKRVGDKRLYDPSDRVDARVIGAVANAYTLNKPSDPRTALLRNTFLQTRSLKPDTIVANAVGHFPIELYDNRGEKHSLTDVAKHAKVTVLNFTAYTAEGAPEYNRSLNTLYTRYHDAGLEIYQVSVDNDEYAWRGAADALPWITVFNPGSDAGDALLMRYNVSSLPATFLLDSEGNIVERADDIATLQSSIPKYLR